MKLTKVDSLLGYFPFPDNQNLLRGRNPYGKVSVTAEMIENKH